MMKISTRMILFSIMLLFFTLLRATVPDPKTPDVREITRLQILLDRAGFSPGEIDGQGGSNTRRALAAFQKARGLSLVEEPDEATWQALGGSEQEVLEDYLITPQDADGPFIEGIPKDLMEQTKLPALNYTSVLEMLSEKFHVNPELLRQMNPDSELKAGETILVPKIVSSEKRSHSSIESIVVSQEQSELTVLDAAGKVIFHAPVTAGSIHEPLPLGKWKVKGVTKKPFFYYNPELFWNPDPSHSKAKLPPGPNNPVGVVWIDLTAEHYGIHGTPEPSKIGHSESNGCVRMTNWDASYLASLIKPGTTVVFHE